MALAFTTSHATPRDFAPRFNALNIFRVPTPTGTVSEGGELRRTYRYSQAGWVRTR